MTTPMIVVTVILVAALALIVWAAVIGSKARVDLVEASALYDQVCMDVRVPEPDETRRCHKHIEIAGTPDHPIGARCARHGGHSGRCLIDPYEVRVAVRDLVRPEF